MFGMLNVCLAEFSLNFLLSVRNVHYAERSLCDALHYKNPFLGKAEKCKLIKQFIFLAATHGGEPENS
jgi:hypothetical protein